MKGNRGISAAELETNATADTPAEKYNRQAKGFARKRQSYDERFFVSSCLEKNRNSKLYISNHSCHKTIIWIRDKRSN